MQADKVGFITPMQDAFMQSILKQSKPTMLGGKVYDSLHRTRPLQVRAVNANLSYRTAQKLKHEGAI